MFPVTADKERALRERMAALGIRDDDLEERFVRSGGKGGQNVNKVATCVVLRHVPSGFAVKCQEARTQAMNRFLARRLLLEKIEADRLGRASRRDEFVAVEDAGHLQAADLRGAGDWPGQGEALSQGTRNRGVPGWLNDLQPRRPRQPAVRDGGRESARQRQASTSRATMAPTSGGT